MLSSRSSIWAFLTLAAAVGIATLFVPRTPSRSPTITSPIGEAGSSIPNFGDVASNILFLVAGLGGLVFLRRKSTLHARIGPAYRGWPLRARKNM
jgi:hypothetical protein